MEDKSKAMMQGDEEATQKQQASISTSPRQHLAAATACLCLCSVVNAFVVMSVFPYAGYMILALLPGRTTPETAGTYAGILASSFMVGRFCTAYAWGQLADRYGRVLTLQVCLTLSAIFSILFGTSTSFGWALVWRFGLGMSNGILSVTKTLANEVAQGDEVWERRVMGLVVGMRSWGMLISPAIGGFLAEPVVQYPNYWGNEEALVWRDILETYPFLLPNLLGALLCAMTMLSVHFNVQETLPADRQHDLSEMPSQINKRLCCCCSFKLTSNNGERSYLLPSTGSNKSSSTEIVQQNHNEQAPFQRPLTRKHMFCHWLFSIVTTYVDEAFPLFCMSTIGGLSYLESTIGQTLSLAGLIFVAFQYATFSYLTHSYGLYNCLAIGCVGGSVLVFGMPLALFFRTHLLFSTLILGFVLGISKLFQSLFFTSMAVAINKTVESHQRGRMNATILVGNSVSKAVGPMLAGAYVAFCFSSSWTPVPPPYGSLLIWSIVPLMGILVLIQVRDLQKRVAQS